MSAPASVIATRQRQRRAAAVIELNVLNPSQQYDRRADMPDWQTLDALPVWCGNGEAERRHLQLLAGAASALPAIRRCLQGRVLLQLQALIGEHALSALRARPYQAFDESESVLAGESKMRVDDLASVDPNSDALEQRLLEAGAQVMADSLQCFIHRYPMIAFCIPERYQPDTEKPDSEKHGQHNEDSCHKNGGGNDVSRSAISLSIALQLQQESVKEQAS